MSRRLDLLQGRWVDEPEKKKLNNPEAVVRKQIEDYLRKIGGYVRQINSGGVLRNGRMHTSGQGSGIPDLLCWLPFGVFIAVEVKAPGKKRTGSESQHKFLEETISRGFKGCLADSVVCVKLCLGQTREEQLATLASFKSVKRPCSSEPLFP